MDLSEDKIVSAFAKVIIKHREADPLTMAERLKDRLMYLMEDADGGSGIRPVNITREEVGEIAERLPESRIKPLREPAGVKAPPLPKGGLILTPDDPEFAAAARLSKNATQRPRTAARVSNLGQGELAGVGKPTEYWTIETLIAAIQEATPAEFYFVPNGCDETVRVRAVRNIQPIIMTQGPSIVRLEYANPGVSQDRSSTDTSGQLAEVVVSLIACETFTLDMVDLGLEAKMDAIESHLKGLYAPRSSASEPVGRDPGPIEAMFNMNDPKRRTPMGENFEIHGEPGWRGAADPQGAVLHSVISTNQKYGNR